VKPSQKLAYGLLTLEAGNLLLLGRDPERARVALEEACKIPTFPEDLLMLAHVDLTLGKREDAEDLFFRAGKERPKSAPAAKINLAVFHYLRALYLLRTERAGLAMADLLAAAHAPCASMYVERARALLPPEAGGEDAPQSSLAGIELG
jgi:hypothetical protein